MTQTKSELHIQTEDQWKSTGRSAQSSPAGLGFVSMMGQTGLSIFRKLSYPQGTPLGTALPSAWCGDCTSNRQGGSMSAFAVFPRASRPAPLQSDISLSRNI